jgi:transcriptional regulator with XRE-family HTH domain
MSKLQPEGTFRQLGKTLKDLRDRANETLAEASGAVEIDVKQLASFELGQNRPTEDVLLLLISHFGVRDDEAVKLWELAGYGMHRISSARMASDEPQQLIATSDERILFTDIVDIVVNNYGVVMNFMQNGGTNAKPTAVARVGMSREHAKSVLQILQVTLAQTEKPVSQVPNKLTASDNSTPDDRSIN